MKKQKIKELYFRKNYHSNNDNIRFGDLPKNIKDDDIIVIFYDDSDNYLDDYNDKSYTELRVYRERDETDAECQKRIDRLKLEQELSRKRRYEHYLKLKKEFDNI